jgi:quercetin dioxygenase-like cupin family protein
MVKGIAAGMVAAGLVAGALAAKEAAKKEIVQQAASDFKWKEVASGMPVLAAAVWKGPGGSQCALNKFPKGFAVPTHTHSKDVHAIVIAGNWGSWTGGGPEKLQGPGGYQLIPANLKHTTKCGDAADCIIYACGPGPFDIKGLPPPPKK